MNKDHIRQITEQSKSEKWPFPKTFEAFKSAGVRYYRFDVPTGETMFMGQNGVAYAEPLVSGQRMDVAPKLDSAAIAAAIKRHTAEHTPFADFRADAARAGVEYWEVSLDDRTVAYFGIGGGKHVEQVPTVAAE